LRQETGGEDLNWSIEHSRNPSLLNDFAAAHMAEASRTEQFGQTLIAFAALERAITLGSPSGELMFNRAMALQRLKLRREAITAWNEYLKTDSTTGWAAEARRNVVHLGTSRISWTKQAADMAGAALPASALLDPQHARAYCEEELLPQWAEAHLKGETEAESVLLTKAARVGRLLTAVTHDRSVEDEVSCIVGARPGPALARAHIAYAGAIQAFRKAPAAADARRDFLNASRQLAAFSSPLALRAAMYAATSTHYSGRSAEAAKEIDRVFESMDIRKHDYPTIVAQLEWVAGLTAVSRGEYESALDHYRTAKSLLEETQDMATIAGVSAASAECLRLLGYDQEAWQQMFEAADLARHVSRQRRYMIFAECARLATTNGYLGAARYFQNSTRAAARETQDPVLECDSLLTGAQLERTIGESSRALRMLDSAERIFGSIRESGMQKRLMCRMEIERGAASLHNDVSAALASLSVAERMTGDANLAVYGPQIHLLKSDAFAAQRRISDAILELHAGIDAYRKLEPSQESAADRATFAQTGRQLQDRLVALSLGRDEKNAFESVLAARDAAAHSVRVQDTGTAMLVYHVLDGELLLWVIRGEERRLIRQPIGSAVLRNETDALMNSLEHADALAATRKSAAREFDLLIRPALPFLQGVQRLQIMTDSVIDRVPFGLLFDRMTQQLLIQKWEFAIVTSSKARRDKLTLPERLDRASLFIVAAPSVSSLETLDGAREEGQLLASRWPGSSLRTGIEATPAAFLEGARRNEIVHFAGHVTDHFDPKLAALRLTAGASGDGRVTASDLEKLAPHAPRLVVLSGCAGAAGRSTARGPLSVTQSLFTAGVPLVVASLCDIDDGVTSDLMLEFYKRIRAGDRPASALRSAQLQSINRSTPPRDWIAFQTYENQEAL